MNINLGDAVALVSVVLAGLTMVIGLPASIYSARKQFAEAKAMLAKEAESYSKAAQQAVESQSGLQTQIDELREKLEARDVLSDGLQKEIGRRYKRILDLEDEIACLHEGSRLKDEEIAKLRS